MIEEFSINISQDIIDDLKFRIKQTRWPDEIRNSGWENGSNLSYLKELASYWQEKFDWRNVEAEINSFPNFVANIDGFKIHFLHIKGKGNKKLPLIITHGWPGSFIEMMKLIPLLTEGKDFSFDLVIPSVIGFGFSSAAIEPGCNGSFVAGLWDKLMSELGYERYAAQGGDIGAGISTWLALKFPEKIIGLHLNYIPGSYKPYTSDNEKASEEILSYQKFASDWTVSEGAYAYMHRSKPITLSYGLNDSPIGLCAWIIEKFNGWSDNHGNIENVFTKDELLANITLYWITQSIHSSIRMYNENSKMPLHFKKDEFVKHPMAFAKFPKELPTPPRSSIEKGFNIQRWTEMPSGGHFAAMEQPGLLANDMLQFFYKIIDT